MTNLIIRYAERRLKERFSPAKTEHRSFIGYLEGWVSVAVNLLLFGLKLALGILSSSIALVADAFHSLADMGTSLIILISFRISKKPADYEHPLGHQRAEAIATIVIATLLFVTGLEVGKSAVERILRPVEFASSWWIIAIVFATAVVKEGMARFSEQLGKLIQSETLKADAWHHRSDALATLLVLGSFLLGRYNIHALDGVVGLIVALLIMYTGYEVAKGSVDQILGPAPDRSYLSKVHSIAEAFPAVNNVHDLTLHQYGNKKFLTMDIEVAQDVSLEEAHDIAEKIAQKIRADLDTHATVHVDPAKSFDQNLRELGDFIQQLIDSDDRLLSFHDLEAQGSSSDLMVRFDLVVSPDLDKTTMNELEKTVRSRLLKTFSGIRRLEVRIEPSYSFH